MLKFIYKQFHFLSFMHNVQNVRCSYNICYSGKICTRYTLSCTFLFYFLFFFVSFVIFLYSPPFGCTLYKNSSIERYVCVECRMYCEVKVWCMCLYITIIF